MKENKYDINTETIYRSILNFYLEVKIVKMLYGRHKECQYQMLQALLSITKKEQPSEQ